MYGEEQQEQGKSTQSRLALYSAAVGLMAAGGAQAAPTQSSVSFTLIGTSENPNQTQSFDIDGDGTDDFSLTVSFNESCETGEAGEVRLNDEYAGNASFYAGLAGGTTVSDGLGESTDDYNTHYLVTCSGWGEETFPTVNGGTRGYVGVKFMIDGQPHFGSLDISTRQGSLIAQLNGACYESEPNTPLAAGACVQAVPVGGLLPMGLGLLALGAGALYRRNKRLH